MSASEGEGGVNQPPTHLASIPGAKGIAHVWFVYGAVDFIGDARTIGTVDRLALDFGVGKSPSSFDSA
jgi:hypothetical protein